MKVYCPSLHETSQRVVHCCCTLVYMLHESSYILFCVIQNKRGHEDPNYCSLSMIDTQRRKHRYMRRDLLSQAKGEIFHPHPERLALACEWFNLNTTGLPDSVIRTIQKRASSTRSLYECKWGVFESWCATKHEIPFQCSVAVVLSFLQDLIDQGKAFSTIKVYLAAISACHIGFDNKTVGQNPLICRFMKGARRALPVSKPLYPSWDLGLVLDALSMSPFEPLNKVDFKILI